jgi:general secretion pathway protein D
MRLVEAFDVNVFERFNHRFYYLEYLDAEEIVETFTNIVASHGDVAKDIVNVIAIQRLNALLVISSNTQVFEKVEVFIRQLDVPSEEVDPRIYVYSVKNGEANNLADLLNSVFAWDPSGKEKTTKDKPEKKAETAPSRNPFSRKTKEAKAEKAPEVRKESRQTVAIGKTETTGSGTLRSEINITADEIRNALIIEAIPADYRVIENILRQIDVLPRQVLIEATIAEISLDESTELGIEWTYLKGPGSLSTSLLDASLGISGFRYTIGMTDRWTSVLKALASENKVNILSSPSILASDNKEAKIDVSREIPLASAEYKYGADTDVTETTIEYRDTGVILSVTPHINERGLVTMDINQEVSEQGSDVTVAGKDYPSFTKRIVQTTLTVKHGQSIVIGGLIRDKETEEVAGVPCLINIPVIRYLAGTESEITEKTELIILITPHVIVSLDDVDAVCHLCRDLCKTPPFAQLLRQAQILILEIFNIFLRLIRLRRIAFSF